MECWQMEAKASGFRSMVVAQFTGVSLQKDDRAFVKYDKTSRGYAGISNSNKLAVRIYRMDHHLQYRDQVYHLRY